MSWQDQLQPASYKGINFGVVTTETTVGRRNVIHEYPFRDTPYAEDMGRRAREYTVKAFCIGSDYISTLQALMSACENDDTPGTLCLPTLGCVTVVCNECRAIFSNTEGGIEYLEIKFVEAGEAEFPSAILNTVFAVLGAVTTANAVFVTHFSSLYNTSSVPDFVANSAQYNLVGSPVPLGGSIIPKSASLTGIMSNIVQRCPVNV
jgi:prophage DNA circulation protein